MRGSMNNQLMASIKQILRIGISRHDAKIANGGKSPFIHSTGTLDKTFRRLQPLGKWLRAQGVRDLEKLNEELVQNYLHDRLLYHGERGNCRQTFRVELSALSALEKGLTFFNTKFREDRIQYDFHTLRKEYSRLSKTLPTQSGKKGRTVDHPEALISLIHDPAHRLMVRLQLEGGCRAEGVGAPQKGSNPFTPNNFLDPDNKTDLGLKPDPVSGELVAIFWTIEKGGKLAYKYCSPVLKEDLLKYFSHTSSLHAPYRSYLASINEALRSSGQESKGRGTHSLRFAFAQRRYAECLKHGYSDEQAKQLVSREMSHNRPDITECYLK